MAEISFGGLATGLPTEELVSSLMAIERRPLDRLEAQKEYESLRLKAYGQFDTRLDTLRSSASELKLASDVRTTTVRVSSPDTISGFSSGAGVGSYDIAVVQLAQVQKNVTAGFSSESEHLLGTGTFSINDKVIAVSNENNSLLGLRDSINAVAGETGVYATIINDGSQSNNYHLVLTGRDASSSFSLGHSFWEGDGNPIGFSDTRVRAAQKAVAYVDGVEVSGNSNSLTEVIAGLTINLNNTSETTTPAIDGKPPVYETVTLNVEADTGSLKEKLSAFVSSYNEIMSWIVSGYRGGGISEEGAARGDDAENNRLSSYLRGDAAINEVKRKLQAILSDAAMNSGSLRVLSEVGISTQRNGSLLLDENKLDTVLETKFEDVVKLLAGDDKTEGVMKRFNAFLVEATSPTEGMLAGKRERYEASVSRLDRQIAQKEVLIARIEERIRAQFNAMELLVSNLNSQNVYLTQQMGLLARLTTGKNT